MSDYEVIWDDSKIIPTLKQEICEKLGEEAWRLLIDGIDVPDHEIEGTLGCRNMRVIIERLEKIADASTIKGILMRVQHGFPHKPIHGASREFMDCGCNIDAYLARRKELFLKELLQHNAEGTQYWGDCVTDEVLDFFLHTEGALVPVRKGSELHIARHPYDMNSYFSETDARRKRFHYCHCLFARTSILSDEGTVSRTMCSCSLGLILSSWEEILGVRLDGEVIQSVLGGDSLCRFIIHLPKEIMAKTIEGART